MAYGQDDLVALLALLQDADGVELKLSVELREQRSAMTALGLDPLGAQVRLVHFFDTPDLALQRAGVVVRARRVQGREDDTVVKLRPVAGAVAARRRAAAPDRETKTRKALTFFSDALRADAATGA